MMKSKLAVAAAVSALLLVTACDPNSGPKQTGGAIAGGIGGALLGSLIGGSSFYDAWELSQLLHENQLIDVIEQ
ncbi:MAG: hypothetical protein COB93_00515, partial [Sneathiella sp.]